MRRPAQLLYGVDEKVPPVPALLMTFQHGLILVVGLLIPALMLNAVFGHSAASITANITEVTAIIMAIASIVLAFRNQWIGCGYLCPAIYDPSYMVISILALKQGGIPLLLGMGIFSGIIGMVFAHLLPYLRTLIPPEVTGICILMIGISLITPTLESSLGIATHQHFNMTEVMIFLITLMVMIAIVIWGSAIATYNLIIGCAVGCSLSYYCHLYDLNLLASLHQQRTLSFPNFSFIGHYTFSAGLIIPFIVVAFSSAMKTLGNVSLAQHANDLDWIKPDLSSIKSAIFTQGLFTVISSLLGGLAVGTSASNVGIAESTRITSRYINYWIGGFLLLLVLSPKVFYFLTLTPAPVRGAIIVYAICFMIVSGIKMIVERGFNVRRILVVGTSICIGLTVHFIPEFSFNFPIAVRPIIGSSLTIATLTAFFLTLIFRIGIVQKARFTLNMEESFEPAIAKELIQLGKNWRLSSGLLGNWERAIFYCLEAMHLVAVDSQATLVVEYDEYRINCLLTYKGIHFNNAEVGKKEILTIATDLLKKYAQDLHIDSNAQEINISFYVES